MTPINQRKTYHTDNIMDRRSLCIRLYVDMQLSYRLFYLLKRIIFMVETFESIS